MTSTSVYDQILDYANRANPYPLYAQLRRTPVSRADDGSYVVSRYRDIVALLHDPRVSSDPRSGPQPPGADVDGRPVSFIGLDPPEHDRIRRILTRQFGPPHQPYRIVGRYPELVELADDLIDGLAGRDVADLVDDFAYPFPVTVICRMLGVPRDDEPRFRVWADGLVEAIDPATGDTAQRIRRRDEILAELGRYLGGIAEARRRKPSDDMLSGLVADDGPDGRLTPEELMSNAALLLFAGHETTVNLIANGMLTLLRHPDPLARLRHQPDFAVPLVEELLRYEPPVQLLPNRYALDDIEIGGTTIPHGAPIVLVLAAGNRDPDRVAEPDRFDPDRPDNEHLGFGGGVHYCFGAPLARLEAQIALAELAGRLENPRLVTDPPPYRPNPVLRGPRHLPVALDRVAPARAANALARS
jgi:cytochrome P450